MSHDETNHHETNRHDTHRHETHHREANRHAADRSARDDRQHRGDAPEDPFIEPDAWLPHGDSTIEECAACHILFSVVEMEERLRESSLRLWVAGWSPIELLDEVVRATGLPGVRDFVVHVLLVDDSHRSDQARTPEWVDRIGALRAMTAIDDVAPGWLPRWLVERAFSVEAECIVNGTLGALDDLLHPRLVA